jgi:hypothetical protein
VTHSHLRKDATPWRHLTPSGKEPSRAAKAMRAAGETSYKIEITLPAPW